MYTHIYNIYIYIYTYVYIYIYIYIDRGRPAAQAVRPEAAPQRGQRQPVAVLGGCLVNTHMML